MKVIALQGQPNVGKTSVLKTLMGKLITGNEFIDSHFKKETVLRMIDPDDEKWFTKKDKKNISNLTVTLKYKGKLVTITSLGDSKDLIVGSLEGTKRRLIKNNIKEIIALYICACHPKMDIETMLGCDCVKYICKEKFDSEKVNDNSFAKEIISSINELI